MQTLNKFKDKVESVCAFMTISGFLVWGSAIYVLIMVILAKLGQVADTALNLFLFILGHGFF